MEEEHRGLGGGGGWAGFHTMVYDSKLAAGRGLEYSAAAQAGDVSLAAVSKVRLAVASPHDSPRLTLLMFSCECPHTRRRLAP